MKMKFGFLTLILLVVFSSIMVSADVQERIIFNNWNLGFVPSGTALPPTFTITEDYAVTLISDYHYLGSSLPAGTIKLVHQDGTVYGPWNARIATNTPNNTTWVVNFKNPGIHEDYRTPLGTVPTGVNADLGTHSWVGEWDTNWGAMVLNQNGSIVTGTYVHDSGKISGSVSGNVLTGTWTEAPSYAPPSDGGEYEFTMSGDGKSFTGKWRYDSTGSWANWDGGIRQTDVVPAPTQTGQNGQTGQTGQLGQSTYPVIKAGTYTVIDSDPGSWSFNGESDNHGFTLIKGYKVSEAKQQPVQPVQPIQPVTPIQPVLPTPPESSISAVPFESGIRIGWNSANGIGYRIFRSTSKSELGISVTDFYLTNTSYADVNVEPNTTYYYTVKVVLAEARPFDGVEEKLGDIIATYVVKTGGGIFKPGTLKTFIMMQLDNKMMNVNGEMREVDPGRGTVPMVLSGRTMVPIGATVQAMSGTISWDQNTRKVTINTAGKALEMWIDKTDLVVNGTMKKMDISPMIQNARTFVPIRFAAENLDAKVDWLNSTKEIVIIYQQ